MYLQLSNDQAEALTQLLDESLGQLSIEIAATDNAEYRARLKERRDALKGLQDLLHGRPASDTRM